MAEEKTMIKLCGLWKTEGKEGEVFFSGKLSYSSRILVFKNKYKRSEKDPDLIIYLAEHKPKEKAAEKTDSNDVFDEIG